MIVCWRKPAGFSRLQMRSMSLSRCALRFPLPRPVPLRSMFWPMRLCLGECLLGTCRSWLQMPWSMNILVFVWKLSGTQFCPFHRSDRVGISIDHQTHLLLGQLHTGSYGRCLAADLGTFTGQRRSCQAESCRRKVSGRIRSVALAPGAAAQGYMDPPALERLPRIRRPPTNN